MLRNFKKIMSVLCISVILIGMTACGKTPNEPVGSTNSVPNVEMSEYTIDSDAVLASMTEELRGTEIEFLNWYDPDKREEKNVIDAFEQKSGIKVNYRIVDYGGYVDSLAGLLTVGETPDVLRMKSPDLGILKLLQPISVTGYDFSHQGWDKHTMGVYTFGENCYGMALVNTPFFLPILYFYNNETFEEMGLENPYQLWKEGKWTWIKFKDMCSEWVNQGPEYTGAALWAYPSRTVNASFTTKNSDGYYELNISNSLAIEAWKFAQEGVAAKLFTNLNDGFDSANQKLLFSAMDASAVQGSSVYFNKTRMRGQLEGVAPPVWEGEEYYLPMMENIAFGIPKSAKNPKAVPYFVSYMANFANYDTSVYDKDSNPTGFFYSEQIKECYMQLLTLQNRTFSIDNTIFSYKNTVYPDWEWHFFFRVDASQATTHLAENEYVFRSSIDLYNADAAKLR